MSSRSPRRAATPKKASAKESLPHWFLRARAYFVHLYTASTVFTHVAALHFIFEEQWQNALLMMGLAVLIDATDGTMARRFNVKKFAAGIDGRRLDDIIDFISFAFLPMAFLLKARLLLQPALLFASLPLLASAFGFGRVAAKLDDEGFFVGFPSYWNIIVFYLWALGCSPLTNTVVLCVLALMVFLPTRYVYPTRYPTLQWLHLLGSYGMGAAMFGALLFPAHRTLLLRLSLPYPVYYAAVSFYEEARARLRR